MGKYFFLENNVTSEGAVSHNVLYYQPLPITCNSERFYDDNYFGTRVINYKAIDHNIREVRLFFITENYRLKISTIKNNS